MAKTSLSQLNPGDKGGVHRIEAGGYATRGSMKWAQHGSNVKVIKMTGVLNNISIGK